MELAIFLVLGSAILVTLAIIAIVYWRKTHIPWRPLPGKLGMFYCFEGKGDPVAVSKAVDASIQALVDNTKWTRADINKAITDLHVHVKKTEQWMENTGDARGAFLTSGLQMDSGVRVGPSLAALCHEIAHRVDQVINHNVNYTHTGWDTNGVFAAVEEYLKAIK
jgi:hypothetical protein